MIKEHLTAAQVRALPVGTTVIWHGRDIRGFETTRELRIVQSGKKKVLQAFDFFTGLEVVQIRDVPNRYFTVKEVPE